MSKFHELFESMIRNIEVSDSLSGEVLKRATLALNREDLEEYVLGMERALAGLEPGDVATLVGLVRRYRSHHDGLLPTPIGRKAPACNCSICVDSCRVIARPPK